MVEGLFVGSQCADLNVLADAAFLVDLGFQGNPFTKINAREGMGIILDKALANPSWLNTYPNTQVLHLPKTYSDHCPLLINVFSDKLFGPFPFCCKELWLSHPNFHELFVGIGVILI